MKNLNRNVNLKKIRNLDKINDFLILENCKLKKENKRLNDYSISLADKNIDLVQIKDKNVSKIENLEKLNSDFIHKLNEEVSEKAKLSVLVEELTKENLKLCLEDEENRKLVKEYVKTKNEEIEGLKRKINLYRIYMVIAFILNIVQIVKYIKN